MLNLVTGATGHIGNVIVRQLLEGGERVRALVRPGKVPVALQGLDVELCPGDVLDPDSLSRALEGVERVYHLAAKINILPGPDPETERVNYEGTLNLLSAMRPWGNRRLVYAGSIYAMRKPPEGAVFDERQPFDPSACSGAYDHSKARAALAVLDAAAQGLDAVVVCPTAVTGPYDFQGSDAGRAVRLYMQSGLQFQVDGGYDFVDVRDVARGFLAAAGRGRRGATYILSGDRLTVREVAQAIQEMTGHRNIPIDIPLGLAYFFADLMPLFCDLTGAQPFFTRYSLDAVCSNSNISHARASRELEYTPRPAIEAVRAAVRWWQDAEQSPIPERVARLAG